MAATIPFVPFVYTVFVEIQRSNGTACVENNAIMAVQDIIIVELSKIL